MILQVRILNELRGYFSKVRILVEIAADVDCAGRGAWVANVGLKFLVALRLGGAGRKGSEWGVTSIYTRENSMRLSIG